MILTLYLWNSPRGGVHVSLIDALPFCDNDNNGQNNDNDNDSDNDNNGKDNDNAYHGNADGDLLLGIESNWWSVRFCGGKGGR